MVLWIFFVSLLISFVKQIIVYRRVSKRMADEQNQLKVLEERNKLLKEKLSEIKSSGSAFIQTEEILGLKNTSQKQNSSTERNYQKWRELFFY